MNRLALQVEAIVGPLRASERRKDRIREELLVHLELACEDARDRGSADPETTALTRFGAIDAVRAEIQDSVPAWERRLWSPVKVTAPLDALFLFDPARDRTPLRYAARRTFSVSCVLAVVVGVMLVLTNAAYPIPSRKGTPDAELVFVLTSIVAATFVSFYALEKTGMRAKVDLVSDVPTGTQVLYLGAFGALWVGSFLTPVFLAIDGFPLLHWVASWSLGGAAAVAGACAFGVFFTVKETSAAKERYRRWGSDPRIVG